MTNIEMISVLGTLLSKKYGKDLFKLLKVYNDISASEASSRLGLHVQTVQEFLESMDWAEQAGLTNLDPKSVAVAEFYRHRPSN